MPAEGAQLAPAGHVPELDGFVVTCPRPAPSRPARRRRTELVRMPAQGAQLAPAGHVPELDGLVVASRGQHLAVRREGDGADPIRMPAEGAQSRPLATSQSLMVVVTAARGQQLAVRREGDGVNPIVCPLSVRSSRPLATSQSLTVLSHAARGQQLCRPARRRRRDRIRMPTERAQFAPAGGVPELDGVVAGCPRPAPCPSGEKATEVTLSVCPLSVRSSRPLATSQSLTVLSLLPEASTLPVRREGDGIDHPYAR